MKFIETSAEIISAQYAGSAQWRASEAVSTMVADETVKAFVDAIDEGTYVSEEGGGRYIIDGDVNIPSALSAAIATLPKPEPWGFYRVDKVMGRIHVEQGPIPELMKNCIPLYELPIRGSSSLD